MARPVALPTISEDSALGGTVIEKSLRFNDGDNAYLSRTPSGVGNRRKWTFSCWVKRTDLLAYHSLFGARQGGTNNVDYLVWWTDDTLAFTNYNSSNYKVRTAVKYRDTNSWYHIVLSVDSEQGTASNRVKMYVNGSQVTSFADVAYPSQNYDFEINRNVPQYIGYNTYNYMDGYMANIHHVDGLQLDASYFGYTDDQTGIWRPKAFSGTYGTNGFELKFEDDTNTTATTLGLDSSGNGNNFTPSNFSVGVDLVTNGDFSADSDWNKDASWSISGGKAVNSGGGEIYQTIAVVSGKTYVMRGTVDFTGTSPIVNTSIGFRDTSNSQYYASQATFSNGSFTDFTANAVNQLHVEWPATITGNVRVRCYASDAMTIDNWSVKELSDVFADSPTKRNKIAHFNANLATGTDAEAEDGGYTFLYNSTSAHRQIRSNLSVKSGKWYAEFRLRGYSSKSGSYPYIGAGPNNNHHQSWTGDRNTAYNTVGVIYRAGSTLQTGHPSWGNGDIISVALDLDNGKQIFWAKNGTYINSANPAGPSGGHNLPDSYTGYYDFIISFWAQTGSRWDVNFGQRPFAYTLPTGFEPLRKDKILLNTTTPITRAKKHFDVVIWDGDNRTSDRTIPLEFRPALVWSKTFVGSNYHNALFTTNTGPNNVSVSDESFAENTANGGKLREFDSKGFTWRYGAGSNNEWWNVSNHKYVAWCWKGGEPDVPISGSTYFDGSGDYVQVAASGGSSDLGMGTGDFTVECWVKKDIQEHKGIWQISGTVGGLQSSNYGETLALGYQVGIWQTYGGTSGPSHESASYPIESERWYHTAVCRSSGTTKLFVDGQQVLSYADNRDYGSSRYMAIGGYYNTSYLHRGSISNMNVVKGTALYTSNFTPPTEPLTAHANTKLLCCQSNTSATAKAVGPTITLQGNTRAENCNPFEAFSVDGVGYPTAALAGLTGGNTAISRATVNTKAGFSLITRKGNGASSATFPHGLGVTPNIVFYKNRHNGANWGFTGNIGELVYGTNKMTVQAATAISGDGNETLAGTNATVIEVGNSGAANGTDASTNYFCFAEVPGFSKFGSYYGTGDADGPFIWCGFKPAMIVVKNTDAAHNWRVHDHIRHNGTAHQGNGIEGHHLEWSTSAAQYSNYDLDFLGNGFKIRTTSTYVNNGSNTYFFMAFAEQIGTSPFETEANAE